MMMQIGIALLLPSVVTGVFAAAQRKNINDGPDDRPGYYKAIGVSLWPYEMTKLVRHTKGRAWIDIYPNGTGKTIGDGERTVDEYLEVILWSHVPIAGLRIFDTKSDRLLLAKDGEEILSCGRHKGDGPRVFPKRYVICALDLPSPDANLRVEVTDDNVNVFVYERALISLAAEIKRSHDWLTNPK